MHEHQQLTFLLCYNMLAVADLATGATSYLLITSKPAFETKPDPFRQQYLQSALLIIPDIFPTA
jgi:hypothetical protein